MAEQRVCPDCGAVNQFREIAPTLRCGNCQWEDSDLAFATHLAALEGNPGVGTEPGRYEP